MNVISISSSLDLASMTNHRTGACISTTKVILAIYYISVQGTIIKCSCCTVASLQGGPAQIYINCEFQTLKGSRWWRWALIQTPAAGGVATWIEPSLCPSVGSNLCLSLFTWTWVEEIVLSVANSLRPTSERWLLWQSRWSRPQALDSVRAGREGGLSSLDYSVHWILNWYRW